MKITNGILFITLITIIVAGSGCTKDKVSTTTTGQPDSCSMNITYIASIAPIIASTCAISSCHVPSGYKDFTTYAALKAEIDDKGVTYILSRIQYGGGMPPSYSRGPSLSACDNKKLVTWLNAGYPNN